MIDVLLGEIHLPEKFIKKLCVGKQTIEIMTVRSIITELVDNYCHPLKRYHLSRVSYKVIDNFLRDNQHEVEKAMVSLIYYKLRKTNKEPVDESVFFIESNLDTRIKLLNLDSYLQSRNLSILFELYKEIEFT